MLSGWLLFALAVSYLAFLFAIAFYGDRRSIYPNRQRLRPYVYGLALGVYCTSWTFYGAVGTAVRDGRLYRIAFWQESIAGSSRDCDRRNRGHALFGAPI